MIDLSNNSIGAYLLLRLCIGRVYIYSYSLLNHRVHIHIDSLLNHRVHIHTDSLLNHGVQIYKDSSLNLEYKYI